jgi:hypothetical protein
MLTGKHMCSDFYLCGTQRREGTAALATRTGTTSAQPQDSAARARVAVVAGRREGGRQRPGWGDPAGRGVAAATRPWWVRMKEIINWKEGRSEPIGIVCR